MVIEVENSKGKKILYGRKMTEAELKDQISFTEKIADPLHEDFAETLARIFEWEIVLGWDYVDYIYNSDKRTLVPFEDE